MVRTSGVLMLIDLFSNVCERIKLTGCIKGTIFYRLYIAEVRRYAPATDEGHGRKEDMFYRLIINVANLASCHEGICML